MKEVQKQEIIDTALLFGFSRSNIDEAIRMCSKPNEEIQLDPVLQWLRLNCSPAVMNY